MSFAVPAGVDFKQLAAGASSSLTVSDRAQLLGAGANTFSASASTGVGPSPSIYGNGVKVGRITSLPAVAVGASSTVAGLITSGKAVTGAPAGTPVLANQALVSSTSRWTVPFNSSTTAVNLSTGTRTLAPGSYGNVQINGGTLILTAGTYFIDSLGLQSGTSLTINNSAGPTFVYVKSSLAFRTNLTGTPENLMLVYLGTTATAIETSFKGTVIAPNASIRLGVGNTPHTGSVLAKSITIDPDVKLTQKAFARWDLIPFDVGLSPTLNCVTRLNPTTFGAVFGYNNTTGTAITLGAGSHNAFAPGAADRGQPILFVPGQVPIASFQTFPAGGQLSYTLGQQSVVASSSSPVCSASLGTALSQLFTPTDDSKAVQQALVDIVSNPRFPAMVAAFKAELGPQISPFQSALVDGLNLIFGNLDLLGDPATFTPAQAARAPVFQAALLAHPAVTRLRLAGDALRGTPDVLKCNAVALLNRGQPLRPFLPPQAGSIYAQTLALSRAPALGRVEAVMGGVVTGSESQALHGASGVLLEGLMSIDEITALQLAGPIPTSIFGDIFSGIVGAIVGAVVGSAGGVPGAIVGAVVGAAIGVAGAEGAVQGDGSVTCDVGSMQCLAQSSSQLFTGDGCSATRSPCVTDADCGAGVACVQACCVEPVLILDLCPGNTCTSDTDCATGNTCQSGCCAGPCGINRTRCDVVTSSACAAQAGTCAADEVCNGGCCDPLPPR